MKSSLGLIFLLALSTYAASAARVPLITSWASVSPVFKGKAVNPLQCLRIYVPAGEKRLDVKNIAIKLDRQALAAIESISLFYTGNEPGFSDRNTVGCYSPSQNSEDPAVKLELGPGIHYIWLGAKLKESADIDSRIEIHTVEIRTVDSKRYRVVEKGVGFSKRLGVVVKKAGEGGVNTFRIPGMATTNTGTLITVYDVRYRNSRDLPGNIDVGMSRSTDGGRTWEPMRIIMDMGEPHENNGVGDPAVLFDPVTRKIWVAALWSKGNRSIAGSGPGLSEDLTGQLVLVCSDDDGLSWSRPKSITPMVKDPAWNLFFNGPGSGIAMADGKIVFAAQYWDQNAVPHSTIVYSADHGTTWKTQPGPKQQTTEAQLIETRPGTLMLNMRDNRGGFRSIATTQDMGRTWTEHHTSYISLQDPVCMASFIKEKVDLRGRSREVAFFGNDNTQNGRYNLTIKASLDLGERWNSKNELLVDDRKLYGYSSLAKVDARTIGFFYEGTGDLYFVRIPVAEIIR